MIHENTSLSVSIVRKQKDIEYKDKMKKLKSKIEIPCIEPFI